MANEQGKVQYRIASGDRLRIVVFGQPLQAPACHSKSDWIRPFQRGWKTRSIDMRTLIGWPMSRIVWDCNSKICGKLHIKLDMTAAPIAKKYREGKLKSTLKRELNRTWNCTLKSKWARIRFIVRFRCAYQRELFSMRADFFWMCTAFRTVTHCLALKQLQLRSSACLRMCVVAVSKMWVIIFCGQL